MPPKKPPNQHLFIKEWFDHKEVVDEDVAERLETNRETVFRWRKEQHRLNPEKIAQLAWALGIKPEDFWRRPGAPKKQSIDAMLAGKDQTLVDTATDIVRRLTQDAG